MTAGHRFDCGSHLEQYFVFQKFSFHVVFSHPSHDCQSAALLGRNVGGSAG